MEPLHLKAVILDWAGTVVDHGSRAPMGAFVRAFAQFGVTISIADARGPMGMAKWEHYRLTHPNAGKPVFIGRSGDRRAIRNIQTTIRHALLRREAVPVCLAFAVETLLDTKP
jgi:beta-phosphoglucomutase-like phosphatase (HAD superfamily)